MVRILLVPALTPLYYYYYFFIIIIQYTLDLQSSLLCLGFPIKILYHIYFSYYIRLVAVTHAPSFDRANGIHKVVYSVWVSLSNFCIIFISHIIRLVSVTHAPSFDRANGIHKVVYSVWVFLSKFCIIFISHII